MTFPMIVTDDLERIMATPSTPKPAPTLVCYAELQAAYAFFNERLFEGALPGALLTMPRHSNNPGYFSADRFGNIEGERLSEIAMNPGYFTNRPVEDVLSHLVHNQAHQYRLVAFPSPPRRGYHDREWASVMLRIGLKPTTTGMPDGKETGDTVDHIIIADGPFMRACQELLATDFRITWFDRYPTTAPAQFGYLTAPNVLDAGQGSGGATSYIIIAPDRTPPPESLDRLSGNSGASAPEIIGSVALGNLSPTAKTGATSPSLPPEYVVTALPPDLVHTQPRVVDIIPQKVKDPATDKTIRWKYTCPNCKTNVWGKHNLHILCGKCDGNPIMLSNTAGIDDGSEKE